MNKPTKVDYAEITITYDPRKMSPTPLRYLIREVSKIANEFTPRLKVNVKTVKPHSSLGKVNENESSL